MVIKQWGLALGIVIALGITACKPKVVVANEENCADKSFLDFEGHYDITGLTVEGKDYQALLDTVLEDKLLSIENKIVGEEVWEQGRATFEENQRWGQYSIEWTSCSTFKMYNANTSAQSTILYAQFLNKEAAMNKLGGGKYSITIPDVTSGIDTIPSGTYVFTMNKK